MTWKNYGWKLGGVLLISMLAAVTMVGCQSTKHALGMGGDAPPPVPKYYDFPDVLVPPEISWDSKGSVVYESGGTKAGILLFSGRADAESLVDFFRKSMPRDGWTLVSSVKFSRILLNFAKPDKTCQILIWDKTLTTEVEVMVNPLRPTTS